MPNLSDLIPFLAQIGAISGATATAAAAQEPQVPAWAELVRARPDDVAVPDPQVRQRIVDSNFAWHVRDRQSGIELLLIPSGTYQRGATTNLNRPQNDELPLHQVQISRAFYLGKTEVTRAQWQGLMGSLPEHVQMAPNRPVNMVSFELASEFLRKSGFRLPTEGEWEYACRANGGEPSPLKSYAYFDIFNEVEPGEVAKKLPNGFGLHDMLGNVREWCSDFYNFTAYSDCKQGVVDPTGPVRGEARVTRGGCFYDKEVNVRASIRSMDWPNVTSNKIGLRVARTARRVEITAQPWAEVLRELPDARIVSDSDVRARIESTGLPWHVRDRRTEVEFLLVPGGIFERGASPEDASAEADERPAGAVEISRPFYLARTELTAQQWSRMGAGSPGTTTREGELPVVGLTYVDAESRCGNFGFRLPTEAEWEYACRGAGSVLVPSTFVGEPTGQLRSTDSGTPDALGFDGLLGNAAEWCSDWYSFSGYADARGTPQDPRGPERGVSRVLRGGSYRDPAPMLRPSARMPQWPDRATPESGCRPVREPVLGQR